MGEELDIHIEELILNASMEDVLGGNTEEFTPSYNEFKRFMLKVLRSHILILVVEVNIEVRPYYQILCAYYWGGGSTLDFDFSGIG